MKKRFTLCLLTIFVLTLSPVFAESDTKVGGHLKYTVYDNVDGKYNSTPGSYNTGAGLKRFILYVRKELSDFLSVDIANKFDASTTATPTLGKIGNQVSAGTYATAQHAVFFTMQLPDKYEARFGFIYPKISWDYGQERFWDEEFNGNKFATALVNYNDVGLEVNKEYTILDNDIPVYFYALNGGGTAYGDREGRNYRLGFNIEPNVFGFKTHLAYIAGRRNANNDTVKRVVGIEQSYGPCELRIEGAYNTDQMGTYTSKKKGYQVKALYKIHPKFKAMIEYSLVDANSLSDKADAVRYKDWTLGGTYKLTNDTLVELQDLWADWQSYDGSKRLFFNRMVVGIRTTF